MKTFLDWSAYQDSGLGDAYADVPRQGGHFAKAVAVCINSGQCEQDRRGVMCPSFRVSQNSHLSPGGRVRLLKKALNEDLAHQALPDPTLLEAMDLCLACKGCKRECESNIDMAMIKTEYLAQIHAHNGVPVRTRLLASLPVLLDRLPAFAYMLSWRNHHPLAAALMQKLMGIAAHRRLPVPVSPKKRAFVPLLEKGKTYHSTVVLLIDTFFRNYKPHTVEAALDVLERAGYRVITTDMAYGHNDPENTTVSKPVCCGRTYIAHGMIDQARAKARDMLDLLKPHAEAGHRIIGLEPACLLAIRDDYLFLGLGEDAETVSAQALLFEEFIAREAQAGRFTLQFLPLPDLKAPVLIHGHCHQKAVGAMKSMRKALKMVPELKFELVESSCCGMAGSFGIEQEHADISLQMAEQDLFPRLREQPESIIVANGFSCQHQIQDGLDRSSLHIAELLQQALPATAPDSGEAC
jgi:Fe-S oxidoreductase